MAIIRIFSAGGIILRKNDDKIEILLTQHSGHKGWEFPKGHIEIGETAQDAAMREVQEESGVVAEVIEKAGDCEYFYYENGQKALKKVTYYLMNFIDQKEASTSFEVMDKIWLPADEVMEKLTYKSTKELWGDVIGRVEELGAKL